MRDYVRELQSCTDDLQGQVNVCGKAFRIAVLSQHQVKLAVFAAQDYVRKSLKSCTGAV